ncbi:MAG: CBS domain-containing protein [Gemmatimonadota bacterium]
MKVATQGKAGVRTVRDVMQREVVAAVPEMTVRELIQVLLEHRVSGAPVLDGRGKLAGVVSMTDVLELAAHEREIPAGQVSWAPALLAEEVDEDLPLSGEEDLVTDEAAIAGGVTTPLGTPAVRVRDDSVTFTQPEPGALPEAALDQFRVRDIMTPVAFSIGPDENLATAVALLLRGRIHRAVVVENGLLCGIVTPFDLLEAVEWE